MHYGAHFATGLLAAKHSKGIIATAARPDRRRWVGAQAVALAGPDEALFVAGDVAYPRRRVGIDAHSTAGGSCKISAHTMR